LIKYKNKERKILNNIIPSRLREARIARGYTLKQLAEMVGVTRQSISQYELGRTIPSGEVLRKIIEKLKFPLSFFTKPIENENVQNPKSAIFFRSLRSTTQKSRNMSSCRIDWVRDIFLYLSNFIDFPKVDIPDVSKFVPNDGLDKDIIEDIAIYVRKYWGLGLGPISNLTLLLEKKGFIISRLELGEKKIDAFSQWRNDRPFIFLGSDKDSAVRSRFDIAHELAHILFHTDLEQEDLRTPKMLNKIEEEANLFAGAFLLPKDSFSQEVLSTSLSHFISLKKRWKVSIAAMIKRCETLDIFTENQILYLNKQLSINRMRKREPLDDVLVPEQPSVLRQAVKLLLDNNIKTSYEILEDLPYGVDEIESLCNLPKGTLTQEGKVIPLNLKKFK